jgi:hypothetical protein
MKAVRVTILLAVIAPIPAFADAMTFTVVRSDYRKIGLDLFQFIYADGEITPGTADRLAENVRTWG